MPWPNFLIIGAAKSGTTSLYHYLAEHPQVFMSPIKEANYFAFKDNGPIRYFSGSEIPKARFKVQSEAEYLALFEGVTTENAIGEASPMYLASPHAAEAIRQRLPSARLVAILRNPIDRAYSGYQMHARRLDTRLSIDQAFEPHQHWVQQSLYHQGLKAYFDRFDRSQIKILLFEDLREDTGRLMSDLYSFLEIDQDFTPNIETVHHKGAGVPHNLQLIGLVNKIRPAGKFLPKPIRRAAYLAIRPAMFRPSVQMPEEVRNKLRGYFKEDIGRLSSLLRLDLESRWQS